MMREQAEKLVKTSRFKFSNYLCNDEGLEKPKKVIIDSQYTRGK
jgi:hypothetical protein